jgi:hypothetical protein
MTIDKYQALRERAGIVRINMDDSISVVVG